MLEAERAARPLRSQLRVFHWRLQKELAAFVALREQMAQLELVLTSRRQALELARVSTWQLQGEVRALSEAVRAEDLQRVAAMCPSPAVDAS